MAEMKPCPFCGQLKYLCVLSDGEKDRRQYQVVCGWQDTLKEAKEAWNRRADNANN